MTSEIPSDELAIEELRPSKHQYKKSRKNDDEMDKIMEEFMNTKVHLLKESIKASKPEAESS
jgi:hypothetical protein